MDSRLRRALWATCAVVAVAPVSTASGEALTFQADAQHSGHVERGGPEPPLNLRWGARTLPWTGYPVVGAGRVFVLTGEPYTYVVEDNNCCVRKRGRLLVIAFSLKTGRRLWARDVRDPDSFTVGSLAYGAGRLVVSRYNAPMLVLAPENGRILRRLEVSGGATPPIIDKGVIYAHDPSGSSEGIGAWSLADGSRLWLTRFGYSTGEMFALSDTAVYWAVTCAGELARLNRADGSLVQPFTTCGGMSGSGSLDTLLSGGRAFIYGVQGEEAVYDADSGQFERRFRTLNTPAVAHRTLITSLGALKSVPGAAPYALVARTLRGRKLWRFAGDRYLDSAPLVVGRTVYVGSGAGRIYGVDLRSGRVRWRTRARRAVLGSWRGPQSGLAAADGVLLVPTYGHLLAFDAAGGRR